MGRRPWRNDFVPGRRRRFAKHNPLARWALDDDFTRGGRGANLNRNPHVAPKAVDQDIPVVPPLPARLNPDGVLARRQLPVSADPDMATRAPAPVTGNP